MEPASGKLFVLLESINIRPAQIPVVNNADAAFLSEPDEIKDSLVRQLNQPLPREDSIKVIIENGVNMFI
jgi:[acyl-carrier-protein] S-malonyltransferase